MRDEKPHTKTSVFAENKAQFKKVIAEKRYTPPINKIRKLTTNLTFVSLLYGLISNEQ